MHKSEVSTLGMLIPGIACEAVLCAVQKLEEAKREARRRGEQKTQTSDAKFDEKFQVGHGLSGEANKPWYAKSGSMLQSEEAAPLQVITQLVTELAGTQQ